MKNRTEIDFVSLSSFCKDFYRGGVIHEVSLKDLSWIKRGGLVSNYFLPKTIEELILLCKWLYLNKREFITIGYTTNIYFKESFSIENIVDTKKLTSFYVSGNVIVCDCGVRIANVAKFAISKGICGYQGLVNLPGTVGGAIVNNSGCYNCGIDKILKKIELLTPEGDIQELSVKALGYTFRMSSLKNGSLKGVILRAYLDYSLKGDVKVLQASADKNSKNRMLTQDSAKLNLGTTVNVNKYDYRNLRVLICRLLLMLYSIFVSDSIKKNCFFRNILCMAFGRKIVSNYISDKRMDCFIWKDENADSYFEEYLYLMKKIHKTCSVEIQIFE